MMMKATLNTAIQIICLLLLIVPGTYIHVFGQTGQLNIPRVSEMPNLPAPYLMRDWKDVAKKYDDFIFSTNADGQYLPLMRIKANGINYPELQPILLDTYVGSSNRGNQAEAINIIPSLIGATLVGVDKSNQNGVDWVIKSKDFFNKKNSQNVYLNGYSSTSGTDWWYDLMPNVFFYQLYSLYPDVADFENQFTSIADRWLTAVYAMGGSTTPWKIPEMSYRAWKLASMTPNETGVVEPEAAGAIAWLLYHAWLQTGSKKYLTGAQLSMEFLSTLNSNPSYELQLPYGAFVAAKMNAELGTQYDVEKMVNWCFDRGTLRGWGVIAGKWNGTDVSGLIGEANDAGNDYAFALNGFQQAAALVPLVKYDKRFARDIAKWTLNLANASRLFYSQYLPPESQDDFTWSSQYDPQSVIAYEALKENLDGKKLYGTGDAKSEGWADTNLGIYGSSHVGYLGAILESTEVEGILKLDLNKTDFYGQNAFQSFLVYNPHDNVKSVSLALGSQPFDIYNAISETVIKTNVTGNIAINVPAQEVMILTYLPYGSVPESRDEKLYVNNNVVDYHYGYNFKGKFRIKSLEVADTLVQFNEVVPVYTSVEQAPSALMYNWYVNDELVSASALETFSWSAPEVEGSYKILLEVRAGASLVSDSITLTVVENIPAPPVILEIGADKSFYFTGTEATMICKATNDGGGPLLYTWTLPAGSLITQNDSLIRWTLPQQEEVFEISCDVLNADGLKASSTLSVLVKKVNEGITPPFAYYPLDGNVLDFSGNEHHATLNGPQTTTDSRGEPNKAYKFSSGSDIIFVPNEMGLNFQDQITVSFWVKLDALTQESFLLSHGSWEERWKISVSPDRTLRWTVKTSFGTKDLNGSFSLELNQYYHVTMVYSGYSLELYTNGLLDTFVSHTGPVATTSKAMTFGRKDVATTNYSLFGNLDEVRIYDEALAPNEIETLPSLWNIVTGVVDRHADVITLYPNPSSGFITITGAEEIRNVQAWDITGKIIPLTLIPHNKQLLYEVELHSTPGVILLRIETSTDVFYKKTLVR